jgi:hypothetical protein
MAQQTSEIKRAALDDLYGRITRVAESNGGNASPLMWSVSFPPPVTAEPQSEPTPALHVEMHEGLRVDFIPRSPLSAFGALQVEARRNFNGKPVTGLAAFCSLGADGISWQGPKGSPLTDDDIRESLKHQGPPPL